jgi:hypothetical protein
VLNKSPLFQYLSRKQGLLICIISSLKKYTRSKITIYCEVTVSFHMLTHQNHLRMCSCVPGMMDHLRFCLNSKECFFSRFIGNCLWVAWTGVQHRVSQLSTYQPVNIRCIAVHILLCLKEYQRVAC